MKLNPLFALLIALIFISNAAAINEIADNDSNLGTTALDAKTALSNVSESAQQPTPVLTDSENSLSWPAIPGESLQDIARAFYPKSSVMRRLFIAKTLRLNTQIEPKLKPAAIFKQATLLSIPTLKSLSNTRQAINAANRAKPKPEKLTMSYRINQAASNLPASNLPTMLLQEYQLLVSKNAFLKTELQRLHAKIALLQTKLNTLKLVLDKTLRLSIQQTANPNLVTNPTKNNIKPQAQTAHADYAEEKVFKNLNENSAKPASTVKKSVKPTAQSTVLATAQPQAWLSNLLIYLFYAVLAVGLILALALYALNKYRQRIYVRFNRSVPAVDGTLTEFGEQWQDTEQEPASDNIVEQQAEAAKNFVNTEMQAEQASALSTLEEARLLMSINRVQDAIAHLKLTIENQPKTSINHCLYLLEIFRKLNLKADFEHYAKAMHLTFNVMTPVWHETGTAITDVKMVVPQHLEEFPHIMEKLDAVWPSELARVYLESLMTDNRDGERAGFSQSALDEILLLIGLLDGRKALAAKQT